MLKILSRIPPDRENYIITKPSPEQYSNSEIKNTELGKKLNLSPDRKVQSLFRLVK